MNITSSLTHKSNDRPYKLYSYLYVTIRGEQDVRRNAIQMVNSMGHRWHFYDSEEI